MTSRDPMVNPFDGDLFTDGKRMLRVHTSYTSRTDGVEYLCFARWPAGEDGHAANASLVRVPLESFAAMAKAEGARVVEVAS